MALATTIAFAGIALAAALFLGKRRAVAALARTFAPVHRLLLGKYYVDEAYNAAIVQPIVMGSERGLWKGVDAGLIDGSVNGVGRLVGGASSALRLLQTGSVRAYAASLFLGVVLVLAYLVWW
jgi:NADH-quinone oxidoreductase subunit L